MVRIYIEPRPKGLNPLLWWTLGIIGFIAVVIVLWVLYVGWWFAPR